MTATAADDGWMQTLTGKKFYPLNPTLDSIDIIDIAGALSKMCRFGGHCNKFYSISEHCWHLSYKASPPNRLAALMHDASEAYIADIVRPIKPHLQNYRAIEDGLMEKIAEKFDFDWPLPQEVKHLDLGILSDEREQNMTCMNVESLVWGNILPAIGVKLKFWAPPVAQEMFLERFFELRG